MKNEVRPWLDLIDGLRTVGIEKDVAIPQIAVMGDQSSGKSSVLEALSGVQFPRGIGLVTKCATELRMKNKKNAPWSANVSLTWNMPQPTEAGIVNSPEDIGTKIVKLTEVLLHARGRQATFEPEHRILIELVSSDVPDLTIIDLPGIVRTALEGQSNTVVTDIDSLLRKYLQQKQTIILAVIPSNVDIATVDIIERARKADPCGDRTVGVLTKPDMIGEGLEQEKVDTLLNITKPLKLGYVMVKNRSQKQIEEGITLEQAKELEHSWFQSQSHFMHLDSAHFGVENLAKKLTDILVNGIKEFIPSLLKDISNLLEKTSEELESLGKTPPSSSGEIKAALMNFLMKVTKDIGDSIKGNYDSEVLHSHSKTRICAQFRTIVSDFNSIIQATKPAWTVTNVKDSIREMRGRELPGFPKFSVFEYFVRIFVAKWKTAALKLLSDTTGMAMKACDMLIELHISQFRRLAGALKSNFQAVLVLRAQEAQTKYLEDLIQNELAPMTENHYFMDTYNKLNSASFEKELDQVFEDQPAKWNALLSSHLRFGTSDFATRIAEQLAELKARILGRFCKKYSAGAETNESQEAEILMAMLNAYWNAASKRFVDTAIQTVERVLLRRLEEEGFTRFGPQSIEDQKLCELFTEELQIKELRGWLKARRTRLRKAFALVDNMESASMIQRKRPATSVPGLWRQWDGEREKALRDKE